MAIVAAMLVFVLIIVALDIVLSFRDSTTLIGELAGLLAFVLLCAVVGSL